MSDPISLTIKSSGDTKHEVSVAPSATVLELKQQIETKADVPADRQRLIYSGKVLKDAETLSSYKVQSGHTIHLVKSAAKAAAGAGAGAGAASASTLNASLGSPPAAAGVPSQIAAGQGSFNPLADLTGARYAGYSQLPSASMFGPDGGMNQNVPDPEQLSQMMSNPMVQEQMNLMLQNPQMLEFMINQSPQLRAMGPQVREMLQSPFVRQMMTNPEMMRSMMEMGRAGGLGGSAAASSFPAPGSATGDSDSPAPAAGAGGAAAANPFASMFPGGAAAGDAAAGAANPFELFGGGGGPFGANANAGANAAADTRPPEERYELQLRQLNDMGFYDFDRNVEALRRTGGSVQGAIEQLLG